jgi:CYTH domain-containing protein
MAAEIERKFRPPEPPEWLHDSSPDWIHQGYLAVGERVEVRVRAVGDQRYLTVKHGHGEVRREVEVELGAEQFGALWPLTEGFRLDKARRRVPLGGDGLVAEVDEYGGELDGLIVAEVEFGSEEEANDFEPPDWLGREITGDERYANHSLAHQGLPADE